MNFITNDAIYQDKIPNKEAILKYLKLYNEPIGYSSGDVIDYFSGEVTEIANALYSDGDFLWTASILYHFEKYNKKLTDEFINHVLNKQ